MTVADDLRQAAIDVFDALTGVPISATYVERATTYVAGGSNVITETPHAVRLIREEKSELSGLNPDVKSTDEKYMLIASELPVTPHTKDQLEIASQRYTIVDVQYDTVDAIATLLARKT